MRLLDRYLLRELLIPLGICLSGFLLLWVSLDLVTQLGDLREKKLTALEIGQYYLAQVPEILVLILPIALLLALLYALTNHTRHHEITAIRAAGISLWRLCFPYLGVGLLGVAALFWLNEYLVPDSTEAAQEIRNQHTPRAPGAPGPDQVAKLGFNNSRDQRTWQSSLYNLETGEMLGPVVISTQPDGSRLQLQAERAIRTNGVWMFFNAQELKIPAQGGELPALLRQTNLLVKPAFSETPEQIKSHVRISESLSLLPVRGVKRADVPIREILNYLRLHPEPLPSERAWLYTKLHGRLAAPWICLVVVLIAVPFGAASGRRNVFVGVANSILICFVYYVLQHFCLALGAGRHLEPWLAGWFPNLAFGVTGLCLTARVR